MNYTQPLPILVCLLLLTTALVAQKTSENPMFDTDIAQPRAKKVPKELTIHGDTRTDNYYWLNQREDPAVIAYLEAENAYFDTLTAHQQDFRESLFQEMKARIKEDDTSVPYVRRGYRYQTSFRTGQQYPIYSRTRLADDREETLFDVNVLAEPFDYYHLGGLSVSDDNRFVAYGVDTLSRRIYTIRVRDTETGHDLTDLIPNTTGSSTWSADGRYLFYSVKDETLRAYRIMRHEIGTSAEEDVLVFEEPDDTFSTYVYRSKSLKYIIIASQQTVSSEYRLIEAADPLAEPRVFQARERDLEYGIDHFDDRFYVLTNYDGARNFQLMVTPEGATGRENWHTVIPARDSVLLEDFDLFRNFLVLSERERGLTRLRVLPLSVDEGVDLAAGHYLDFQDPAYVAYTTQNIDFETDVLRYGYQSLTTPGSTYDYDMTTRERTLLKQQPVLGDFDPADYASERRMVPARDGELVPVSIVYRRGTALDGTAPLLLYAYGSYGYSMDPTFSTTRLSLLDRGFVYAIAHIRGGQELGRRWYEDGKLLNKMNTFTDFIDVGDWLVANDYAANDQLYAMGGSAGGLLMGAVANLRPDRWAGIVAAVPFVDVITTMLDESIPLTTGEYDEWGIPNDKQYYDYIKAYSPYDQVTAQDYPTMLVTTGLHDSQVQYWEPAKWVAKLRELRTNDKPLLLHTDMKAGHGGASGRFERLREIARDYAFLIDLAGRR